MACEIEIKKSIEKSIDKQLPNREAVMSKSAAESIVNYLNNLWKSAISRIAMYSSQGGYKVVINDLTDAVNKEYKRQVEAEKEFERDIDFFNGDEALLEQERRELQNIQLQEKPTQEVKPGVEELFESNPDLANAVYEALGFKTIPSDISKIKDFEGTIIEYVEHIGTHKDGREIGARNINKGEKIQVVLNEMRKKFEEKSWVNPVNSEPLSQDAFSSFEELMMFMYLHEKAHEYILQEEGESLRSYETRVNNEALKRLNAEFKITPQQKQQAQQLYSQYLNTIFPDSKVKGINYHGTEYQQKFEKFDSRLSGTQTKEELKTKGFWFTYQRDVAEDFGSNVISVLLNVKNPYRAEAKLSELNVRTFPDQVESVNKAINKGYDSAFVDVLENLESGQGTTELVVFEPEQIHILGNQQDIERFKEFASNQPDINQKDLFLQKKSSERTITSKANQKTINAVKDFLNRIGVTYKSVSDIYVNGVKLDENAIANITRSIIEVIDGKESESLPEEAMHFLVEIVQQTNPKLFNELLKEANNYQLTRDVFADYSTDPLYQTKDGKPDVIKLKKEAIAKILVETIINKNEGLTEKPQLLAKTQSLFGKILNWFRSLFIQSGFDKLAMDVLSGKDLGTVEDIVIDQEEDLIYLQKSSQPSQEEVFNSLKENGKTVEKKGNDGYFINGKKIPRVSDIVASWYDRRSKSRDITKSEFEKAVDDLKSEKGTSGHSDIEFAFSRFVDENGYLRNPEDYLEDGDYVSQLNPNDGNKMYSLLKKNLRERLESFPDGTRFLAETIVYSPKRNLAGTIDFIAVEPDGKINILDWKFMSLNTNRYEDVPWYKVNSWQIQMEEYKAILSDVLKVKDGSFKQTRMIPIRAVYSGANVKENILPKLLELEIGGVNVKDIEEDYLLPVGLEKETTGNKKIDELLEKLNNVYKKISEKKALPSEKASKAEQLNSLFYAIRQLQIKQNVKPLVEQTIILNKQIKAIIDEYNEKFKDKPANSFSEKEINEFAKTLELGREAIQTYENLDIELKFLFEGELDEEMKELKSQLRDAVDDSRENAKELENVDKEFTEEIIALSEGIENLSTPEKIVKGLTRLFGSTSTIQLRSLQVLYKKANKAFGFASMEVQEEAEKLSALRDEYMKWAKRKGLSPKNMFDIIRKKDKNELIDEFDKDFYKQLKQNIGKKDISWIKENINIDEYTQYLKEKKEKEIDFIKNKTRTGTPERIKADILRELAKVEELYSLTGEVQLGWLLYDDIKKFPKKKWESKEWKELTLPENKPAKDFYDYIKERNTYYESIGYINAKQARTFLPWVRKGLAEKMIFGGQFKIGEEFLKNISMDENEVGYGQIDPITGKPVDVIPTYFTTEFKDEEYSEDLFKTMALYNQYAIKFNYLTEIDAQARALVRTERNKKSIATSIFGKTRYENGELKLINDNSENTKLLESMVKAIIYQQKYIDNEAFDIVLGRLNNFGDTLNKKLGVNIFPKNLSRREISLNKTVSQINSQFQLTALGLNALSSLSNYFGGTSQSIINAGRFFTKTDHMSTQAWVLQGRMMGGEDRQKALAAIKYFMPFTEDFNRDIPNELSVGKFNDESIQNFLMYLMRNGDAAVQTINFYSFLRNAIVVDGEIKNVREYLRSTEEYSEMYAGTKQEIDARAAKFEEDVKKLKEEKGVLSVSELKNGKLEIPGVNRKSQSVIEFRRNVQQFTSDALGSMTEENKRLINLNVYGASFMIFKNWIPRLVDVRFGELKYNSASDAYEWGRTRTVAKIISQDLLRSINNLRNTLVGNEKGIEFIRNLYETKKEQYERDTNKELKMTEDEFIQLVRQNLKNQLADVLFYATLFALSLMAKALVPDDDEDPMVKNQAKFIVKATDKFKDELGYFYNPTSILNLTRSGIFPSLSLIDNYKKVFLNSIAELYGLVVQDDKLVEDNDVIKYLMRSFPISNQFASYLPMLYPEMAKDLGIKMQSQYGFR